MAGGLGTRLKPLTEVIPKPLLPVGQKSILGIIVERLRATGFEEIILAINPTSDGEATILYLEGILKKNLPASRQVTRLGLGLPIGGELEYADEETLVSAIERRK